MRERRRFDAAALQGSNSRLWAKNTLLTGPDYYNVIGVYILIAVTTGLYFPGAFIWLLPTHPAAGVPLLLSSVALVATSLVALFRASTSDPGIVPRKLSAGGAADEHDGLMPVRELVINSRVVRVKFCETCRVWRPPRASHCSQCNNCVERFDHHCPYLSNCVGEGNYRQFFCFVLFTALLSVVVLSTSIGAVAWKVSAFAQRRPSPPSSSAQRGDKHDSLAALNDGVMWILLPVILVAVLAFAFTGFLTGFHLFLMFRGASTSERIKRTFRRSASNPYEPKGVANVRYRLCGAPYESKVAEGYSGEQWKLPPGCEVRENGRLLQARDDSVIADGCCASTRRRKDGGAAAGGAPAAAAAEEEAQPPPAEAAADGAQLEPAATNHARVYKDATQNV